MDKLKHRNNEDTMASSTVVPRTEAVVPCPPVPLPEKKQELILCGVEAMFVAKFVQVHLKYKNERQVADAVSDALGIRIQEGRALLRRSEIRDAIKKKIDQSFDLLAQRVTNAFELVVETLDDELLKTVKAPIAKGIVPSKVEAIKVGYGRLRIPIKDAEPEPVKEDTSQGNPIYRAIGTKLHTKLMRQTVTEVIEQTEETVAAVTESVAPALSAQTDSDNPNTEYEVIVEDY
jgi:DNA-binding protein Fis